MSVTVTLPIEQYQELLDIKKALNEKQSLIIGQGYSSSWYQFISNDELVKKITENREKEIQERNIELHKTIASQRIEIQSLTEQLEKKKKSIFG